MGPDLLIWKVKPSSAISSTLKLRTRHNFHYNFRFAYLRETVVLLLLMELYNCKLAIHRDSDLANNLQVENLKKTKEIKYLNPTELEALLKHVLLLIKMLFSHSLKGNSIGF